MKSEHKLKISERIVIEEGHQKINKDQAKAIAMMVFRHFIDLKEKNDQTMLQSAQGEGI